MPCKTLAEELGLRIHQRETFRMWDVSLLLIRVLPVTPTSLTDGLSTKLPHGTNLVVVVSFGLFVPRRILSSAKYGGLNVHPSLLPECVSPLLFIIIKTWQMNEWNWGRAFVLTLTW